jgi:hypothetical protein
MYRDLLYLSVEILQRRHIRWRWGGADGGGEGMKGGGIVGCARDDCEVEAKSGSGPG